MEGYEIPVLDRTAQSDCVKSNRPFYFIIVLWGERFRHYFLEYCLPTLLSPQNIPALSAARSNKFLIATHAEDWEFLKATPIFARLEQYLTPVFLELPRLSPESSADNFKGLGYNLALMGIGHRLASTMAFRDHAYATYLSPDCMVSEGTVARLQTHAENGVELVLTVALRLGEEPFFDRLQSLGVIPRESRAQLALPLTISARQMVDAALDGLHSETLTYEWDAPYFFAVRPSAVWWRVPGENGMLIHGLNWQPLLLDFGAVAEHDTSSLENWTLDGDYVYKNLGASRAIYVVQDSDEMFLASWGPMSDRPRNLERGPDRWFGFIHEWNKGLIFRQGFYSGNYDLLKQGIFFLPLWWHVSDITPSWAVAESCAARILRHYVSPPRAVTRARSISMFLWTMALIVLVLPLRVHAVVVDFWGHREMVRRRIGQMLRGDAGAWQKMFQRLRKTIVQIFT